MYFSKPHLFHCLDLAKNAVAKGNHPFGAILVLNGEIVLEAENKVVSSSDFTAHAEMELVRQASKNLEPSIIRQSTLYTSTEPCAMCCGAIYWAKIPTVVFGCSNKTLSRVVGGSLEIDSMQIFNKGHRATKVIGPVDEANFVKIHEKFWNS